MSNGNQQQQPATGVRAILQKVGATSNGQAVTVHVTAEKEVTSWYAELVLPTGATASSGPGTTVTTQGSSATLTPTNGHITPPSGGTGRSSASAAISGSGNAPQAVRVQATFTDGSKGFATVDGLYVTGTGKRVIPASEQTWPGSSKTVTDPTKFHTGGGFGHGGGGGGGGQFSCDLFVDFANQTVKHTVGSDAGGGGGSGGGGGQGSSYQQNNHQQQG